MSPLAGRRPAGPWTVSIACLIVASVVMAVVAVVGLAWIRSSITHQVEESQRLLAEERAGQLSASLGQMRDRVEAIAGQPLFASIVDDGVRLEALLGTAARLPGVVGYTLRDDGGRQLVRIPALDWPGRTVAGAADQQDALVRYRAPVRPPDGRRLWLEQLVSVRELLPHWAAGAARGGGQVSLVRVDGEILITDAPGARRLTGDAARDAVAAGRSAEVTYDDDATAGRRIAAITPVEGSELVVLASQPQSRALAAAQRLTVRLMALLVGCSLVLAALGVIVARAIQRLRVRIEAERREAEALALTDPLTGLANRRALELAVAAARSAPSGITVAALDVDGLKTVNDRLGHGAGDLALRQTGDLLRSLVRPEDVVARTGGDEFVILWRGTDADRARLLEARVREEVGAVPSMELGAIGLSVGVAHGDAREFDRLLALADQRCYADKRLRKAARV